MVVYKKILQSLISIFLSALFAFSVTPVIVLHNLIADHTDTVFVHHHTKSHEVAKAGIDCHVESFVAERNFIAPYNQIIFCCTDNFSILSHKYIPPFYSAHHLFTKFRGPPAKA